MLPASEHWRWIRLNDPPPETLQDVGHLLEKETIPTVEITRVPRRNNFSILPNEAIENTALSWRARGILAFLLSRPDNWQTSAERLAEQGKEGRDAIRVALKELDTAGYLRRTKVQGEGGRWSTIMQVFDEPQPTGPDPQESEDSDPLAPTTDFQASADSPTADFQPSVNQSSLTRTETKNSLNESDVVVSPNVTPEQQHHPGGGMPATSRWTPSAAAMKTASDTVTEVDIPLHITRYIIVKAEKKQEPTSSEWLKWLIADENKARALAKQQMAEQGRSKGWASVAE